MRCSGSGRFVCNRRNVSASAVVEGALASLSTAIVERGYIRAVRSGQLMDSTHDHSIEPEPPATGAKKRLLNGERREISVACPRGGRHRKEKDNHKARSAQVIALRFSLTERMNGDESGRDSTSLFSGSRVAYRLADTLLNTAFEPVPTELTAARQITAISASIRAYSTIVAPHSSLTSFLEIAKNRDTFFLRCERGWLRHQKA